MLKILTEVTPKEFPLESRGSELSPAFVPVNFERVKFSDVRAINKRAKTLRYRFVFQNSVFTSTVEVEVRGSA